MSCYVVFFFQTRALLWGLPGQMGCCKGMVTFLLELNLLLHHMNFYYITLNIWQHHIHVTGTKTISLNQKANGVPDSTCSKECPMGMIRNYEVRKKKTETMRFVKKWSETMRFVKKSETLRFVKNEKFETTRLLLQNISHPLLNICFSFKLLSLLLLLLLLLVIA